MLFQKWIKDELLEHLGIDKDEIRVTVGSENGADVQLITKRAQAQFPFSIECKRQEGYAKIYKDYEQACNHKHPGTPIVVLKSNRKSPLVVMSWEDFVQLVKESNER